jgi:hypothetical protein
VYGQAQCDGGIVCDMSRLDSVAVAAFSAVTAGAGARWSAVLDAALRHGLTPPVLTDYLELTVGGTLAAGGIGGASHRYGPQVDDVRELVVVTRDGGHLTCSATRNPEVFSAALGGNGRAGTIVGVTLPLVAAPRRVRVHRLPYPTVGALATDQVRMACERRFGYLEGQILPDEAGGWRYIAEAATFGAECSAEGSGDALNGLAFDRGSAQTEEMTYHGFCHRMTPGVRELAATGDWYRPHPWFSVFLPAGAVEQYVNAVLAGLKPAMLGPLPVLLYPLRRGTAPAPGLVTPGRGEQFFSFSLLRTTASCRDTAAAIAHNEQLRQDAIAAGGCVYGISALPASGS